MDDHLEDTARHERTMVLMCTGIATPLILILIGFEVFLAHTAMIVIMALAAGLTSATFVVAYCYNPSKWLLRATLFYLNGLILYTIFQDYAFSTLLYILAMTLCHSLMLGRFEGLLWNAVLFAVTSLLFLCSEQLGLESLNGVAVDFLSVFVFVVVASCSYEHLRSLAMASERQHSRILEAEVVRRIAAEEEKKRLIRQLQGTVASISRLGELVPICSGCKKIRDDEGYWQSVERYLAERTDLLFSHGYCPECSEVLYRELDQDCEGVET